MKKLVTGILALTLTAGATLGLAGCGMFEGGNAMDDTFDAAFKATVATSYTVEMEEGYTYEKSQAAQNDNRWGSEKSTVKVDLVNLAYEMVSTEEEYVVTDGTDTGVSVTETTKGYAFVYNNKYYVASKMSTNASEAEAETEVEWSVSEYAEDKEEFEASLARMSESIMSSVREELTTNYAMRNLFTLNESTSRYELKIGTSKLVGLQSLEDGAKIELYNENTASKTFKKMVVSAVGTTTITIPEEVKTAVSEYVAAQTPAEPEA